MTIENSLKQSLDIVQVLPEHKKMTDEQYSTLTNLDLQIKGCMHQLAKKAEFEQLDDQVFTRFLQTSEQYRTDLDSLKQVDVTRNNIELLVKQLLQMANIQKLINFQIVMKLL